MTNIKPILFSTDMVSALLDNRKTVTRRVVKPRYCDSVFEVFRRQLCEVRLDNPSIGNGDRVTTCYAPCKPPYSPGDILYVRETFRIDYLSNVPGSGRIHYKADDSYADFSFSDGRYEMMRRAQLKPGWRPNENMPREAARIFLRVTDVLVERLQDITDDEIFAEGIVSKRSDWLRLDFADEWNSTIKLAGLALYGWGANPWVWVIEFERISKEEAYGECK